MSYLLFKKRYDSLSNQNQHIVYEMMSFMQKKNLKKPKMNDLIYKEIIERRNALGYTYNKLCFAVEMSIKRKEELIIKEGLLPKKEKDPDSIKKAYQATFKNKTIDSYIFNEVISILNIKKEIENIKNNYQIQIIEIRSLEWKYNRLSEHNQKAIEYLANILKASEDTTELFPEY